jgi:hypothetical protein
MLQQYFRGALAWTHTAGQSFSVIACVFGPSRRRFARQAADKCTRPASEKCQRVAIFRAHGGTVRSASENYFSNEQAACVFLHARRHGPPIAKVIRAKHETDCTRMLKHELAAAAHV